MRKIKYFFWRILKRFNLEILPYDPRNSVQSYLNYILHKYEINLILDIGASEGQYVGMLRNIGYEGKIVSFEPIKEIHDLIVKKSKKDKKWTVYDRLVISEVDGAVEFNISNDSVSSSVLNPKSNNPFKIKSIRKEKVISKPLENVIKSNNYSNFLLKIDAQGLEEEILRSARDQLKKAKLIQLEASFKEIYENEKTFFEIYSYLQKEGFDLIFIYPGASNSDYEVFQCEMIFKNNELNS